MIKKRSCQRLVSLLCITLSAELLFLNQIQCSSYLDDYFLPTAKLALNKIQQSLSPNSLTTNIQPIEASTSLAQVADNVTAPSGGAPQTTTLSSTSTTTTILTSSDNNITNKQLDNVDEPPVKTDFVKLDTQFELTGQSQGSEVTPVILSSTLASNEDQTSTLATLSGDDFNTNSDATLSNSEQPSVVKPDAPSSANFGSSSGQIKEDATLATTTITIPTEAKQTGLKQDSGESLSVTDNGTGGVEKSQDASAQERAVVASDIGGSGRGSGSSIGGSDSNNHINGFSGNTDNNDRQPQTGNAIVTESKSTDEAAIKETELDAVAAVDASIGFGVDLFASMSDPCYDEYGNARYCEPEFENAAFEKQVEVSSECGSPPSRFCTAYLNEHNDQIRNCHICDSQHPKKRHPAAFLTDLNNPDNPTCWVSAPINAALLNSSNSDKQQQDNMVIKSDNVTLILNLDKKYEIIYISMQFCSIKPDSLAIFKSMDYGQTWLPYQFYSSQCRKMYGRPSKSIITTSTPSAQSPTSSFPISNPKASAPGVEQYLEPSCLNGSQTSGGGHSGRFAFSPLGEGRASEGALSVEKSPVLQDWITATNIKIILDRHQANWIHSNLVYTHHHSANNNQANKNSTTNNSKSSNSIDINTSKLPEQQLAANQELENSLTSPSNTFNYAMSDLTVGGRCKCNGHASRCIHSKEGRLQCDCRHNTAGRDCEKCATLHFDRPWARATQSDANPCQPCNCNGHSRKCRFDADLYRSSGRRSGGVCIGCRDNTAGRYCHYCREGFTRDYSKPMSDKEACKHCECHPIGSLGKVCNQTTGQCPCKEGVTGLQCNRCAPGYQQSNSLSEPCLKLPENDINYEPSLTVESEPDTIDPSSTQSIDQQQQQQRQSNNNPPDNNNIAVEPSLVTESSNNIAPPIEGRLNKANNGGININQLDDGQDNSNGSVEDGDNISEFGDQVKMGRQRSNHLSNNNKNYQWNQVDGRHRNRNNYYRYNTNARHHNQYSARPALLDEDEDFGAPSLRTALPVDDGYMPPISGGRGYYQYNRQQPQYMNHKYPVSDSFNTISARPNRVSPRIQPNDILMKPNTVNLDHGVDDIINSPTNYDDSAGTDQQESANSYGPIYNEDTFNHIHSPSRNRIMQQQPMWSRQPQQLNNVDRFRMYNSNSRPIAIDEVSAVRNSVSCGDCQSSTRRLGSKQFCHSEFAIKATILNRFMADDWTKFDVEIQDIFKSTNSDHLNRNLVNGVPTNYVVDNMVQSDEAILERSSQVNNNIINNNSTQVVSNERQQPNPSQSLNHKIKVGTVQSIWVPTEDLTCKCPKLKLRATYLLMGTIDAKENSANSLQLDRHGTALEWKSSFQEKLIKYQRRLAKGTLRC